MTKYIAITYEVSFVRRDQGGDDVIHEGLPFTVPEGEISMILEHVDGTIREMDHLIAGTFYADEPRPTEPEAQSFYDRIVRERAVAKAREAAVHEEANAELSVILGP